MNTAQHDPHAVRRRLETRAIDQGEANVQTISHSYATSVEDLWDAVTNAERLPRWFAPVSGDLELGGRYQVEGNAGGTIETCEPPHRFSATWEYNGQISWIAVAIRPEGEGSRLELEHAAVHQRGLRSGTPREQAEAAAARTTAFYTGQPDPTAPESQDD